MTSAMKHLGAVGAAAAAIAMLASCGARDVGAPERIVVERLALGTPLTDPQARFWGNVAEVRVPIQPQTMVPPTHDDPAVGVLRVRTAHDGELLAVRLEWEDATESVLATVDKFGDQVAIQFPMVQDGTTPAFTMGHAGVPVRILQWRGILQGELAHGPPTIRDLYPNAVYDLYPDRLLSGEVAAPYTGGRAVGNPVSQPRLLSPVVSHVAEGFGTLTAGDEQAANGRGVWRDGRWHVVIVEPFSHGADSTLGLRAGMETMIAFAVWDGENKEVGSRKGWANWIPLRIEE